MRAAWLLLLLLAAAFAIGASCDPADDTTSLYVALGDSLSEGVGASDPRATGLVPLVQAELDEGTALLNLGHSGDTSADLIDHGHLDDAVAEIELRNGDDDSDNDVSLVTLEIGGNDLLRLYFTLVVTGRCPDVESSINDPECTEPLRNAFDGFEPNLAETLDALQAADPELRILLMTLYNPFPSGSPTRSVGDLSLEGMPDTPFEEGLNDIVRRQAAERDLTVAEVYEPFQGRSDELISGDHIHPNDAGYRVMADAVIAALGE
jgi:lysophospholipase L1-like esterase